MRVSDVTVTFNNINGLKKTIESIINSQFSPDIELQVIVIDGGSSDGTREYLEQINDRFNQTNIDFTYVSEKDNGIYNAMNKGINLANGDWIFFLNAGDILLENFSFGTFFENAKNEEIINRDILYGDSLRDYGNDNKVMVKPLELSTIRRGLPFSHQSVFVRTELFKNRRYDESFRISGDYEWFLNAYLEGRTFGYVPICVSCFDTCGISATHLYENYLEADRIRSKYGVNSGILSRKIKLVIWFLIDKFRVSPYKVELINNMIGLRKHEDSHN